MTQSIKTRSSVEATLIRKAWADREFKEKLLSDPTSAYTAEMENAGASLPAGTEIQALAEDGKTLYLVIPRVDVDPNNEVKLHERSTRSDFEAALILRAMRDANFKQQLIADPKAAYEAQLATIHKAAKLPENLEIRVLEESDNLIYFRLPQAPPQGGELSEEQLEEVAGGAVAVGVVVTSVVTVGAVALAVAALVEDSASIQQRVD